MKPFQSQTYYELLEVASTASIEEIRAAYQRASSLYAEDSVAMYALEDPTAGEALRARIAEAFATLTDPDRRDDYDRKLGLPARPRASRLEREEEEPAAPAQLAMHEVLSVRPSVHSTHPQYQISYIPKSAPPKPPEPQRVELRAPRPEPVREPMPEVVREPAPASAAPVTEEAPEPVAEAPRRSARPLEEAPEIAQESAIASAEAAMAQVQARARDIRPKGIEIPKDAVFNGELLRQVREGKGLSLQLVSDRTRISKSHLENVEADRYEALPAPVYLRGILVSLARELGLDPVRVSKAYLTLAGEKSKLR